MIGERHFLGPDWDCLCLTQMPEGDVRVKGKAFKNGMSDAGSWVVVVRIVMVTACFQGRTYCFGPNLVIRTPPPTKPFIPQPYLLNGSADWPVSMSMRGTVRSAVFSLWSFVVSSSISIPAGEEAAAATRAWYHRQTLLRISIFLMVMKEQATAGIEVATAMLLEVRYCWPVSVIGVVIGIASSMILPLLLLTS